MEKFETGWVEKLSPGTKKDVGKTVERLRGEGYNFGFEETGDEYIVVCNGTEHHITKLEHIPYNIPDKEPSSMKLSQFIETTIIEFAEKAK